MDAGILAVCREALLLALLVSAPPLLAGFAVGLLTGVLQAATQVQEPAVGVVPRLAAVLGALLLAAPWIAAQVLRFAAAALDLAVRAAP
jgi:flagellar biosynthesis protein FliQ